MPDTKHTKKPLYAYQHNINTRIEKLISGKEDPKADTSKYKNLTYGKMGFSVPCEKDGLLSNGHAQMSIELEEYENSNKVTLS